MGRGIRQRINGGCDVSHGAHGMIVQYCATRRRVSGFDPIAEIRAKNSDR
jgi:hypothetical protein